MTEADSLTTARRVLAGQPFSAMLGAEIVECGPDGVVIELGVRADLMQNNGFVHGGVLAYLADVGLSFAAGYAIGAGVLTAEIKVNFLRPAVGEKLVVRAKALVAGRIQGVSRCEIYVVADGVERLCAAAQGSVLRIAQPE